MTRGFAIYLGKGGVENDGNSSAARLALLQVSVN